MTAAGVCSLLFASLAFFLLVRHTMLDNFAQTQAMITKVAAKEATQAMLNQDTRAAKSILHPLGYHPGINLACLYGAKNVLIAASGFPATQTSSRDCPEPASQSSQVDTGSQLHSFEQIIIKDIVVGTLYTRADQSDIKSKINVSGALTALIFLLSLFLLYGLSLRFQREITQPIQGLCNTVRSTLKERSYKKQITVARQDEIGRLAKLFQNILRITEHYESELDTLAHKDIVTGLPNRRMLMQYLEKAINKLQRSGDPLAILVIHVHGLSAVNQRLSHEDGDAALMAVAERLQSCARSEDIIARLGGNTFIALMLNAPEIWRIRSAAERVTKTIEEPVYIKDETLDLTAHIGISVSPQDGQNPNSLLKMAELASQTAREGMGSLCFFNKSLQGDTLATKDSALELQYLLDSEKMQIYVNPIFQLGTLNIKGIELALFTEDTNQAPKACDAIVDHCENKALLQQMNDWLTEELALCLRGLGVNIFSKLETVTWQVNLKQIFCGNFVSSVVKIANIVNDYGMTLLLAVSEKDIQQLTDSKLHLNEELKPLGVGLAVNASGAGSSVLGRLPNLPIRQIRFNCQQVNKRTHSRPNSDVHEYLNQVIIELSNLIDLECVARNITVKAQADQFNQMSCEYGQGDYFSDLMPLSNLPSLLEQTMPLGASTRNASR